MTRPTDCTSSRSPWSDVLEIVDREKPDGVIVQFGGKTPLKLALPLWNAGVPIIGTSPDAMTVPKTARGSRRCCWAWAESASQ